MHILHYTAECIWALENENCKLHKYETRCIRCEKKIREHCRQLVEKLISVPIVNS